MLWEVLQCVTFLATETWIRQIYLLCFLLFRVGFYMLFVSLFFWRVFLGRQEVVEADKTFSLGNLHRKGRTEQNSSS